MEPRTYILQNMRVHPPLVFNDRGNMSANLMKKSLLKLGYRIETSSVTLSPDAIYCHSEAQSRGDR